MAKSGSAHSARLVGLGRPVVHLGVDVDRVLAAPGRGQAVVPDALEIGRLAAGARAADEQVAAVLEEERGEGRIVARGEAAHALVGRQVGFGRSAEVERHAAEQALVFRGMRSEQLVVGLARGGREGFAVQRVGVAADVVVAAETGGRGDEDECRAGAAHVQLLAVGAQRTAVDDHLGAGLKRERARDVLGRTVATLQDEQVVALGAALGLLVALRTERESETALVGAVRRGGRDADHDHLVHRTREHLAHVDGAHVAGTDGEGGSCDRGVEIKFAPVGGRRFSAGESEHQVADGLVGHLPDRSGHELRLREFLRRLVVAVRDQPAHLGQVGQGLRVGRIVGAAGPESVLIELEPFLVNAAKDHGAQTAVAYGQRLDPFCGGPFIAEDKGLGVGSDCAQEGEKQGRRGDPVHLEIGALSP